MIDQCPLCAALLVYKGRTLRCNSLCFTIYHTKIFISLPSILFVYCIEEQQVSIKIPGKHELRGMQRNTIAKYSISFQSISELVVYSLQAKQNLMFL